MKLNNDCGRGRQAILRLSFFEKIGYHDHAVKEDMGTLKEIGECEASSNIKIRLGT